MDMNGNSGFALVQLQIMVVLSVREDLWQKKIQSQFYSHNSYPNGIQQKMKV